MAEVDDGVMGLAADSGVRGVNAGGRQNKAICFQVRSRKSELVAEPVAGHNLGGEGVGAAEHLAGGIEVARANGFADSGAANNLAIKRHGGDPVDAEIQFGPELLQERNIAAPLVAEDEVRAHADAVEVAEIAGQLADEAFAGLSAERLIEMNQQQGVRSERFDGLDFSRQGIDQRWHAVWRDDGARVAVEGEDHGEAVGLAGGGEGSPDDLLMPEVDAIKDAEGETDFAVAGLQLGRVVDQLHGPKCSNHGNKRRKIFAGPKSPCRSAGSDAFAKQVR